MVQLSAFKLTLESETNGIDLTSFFISTLHKSPRDRRLLLEFEKILRDFVLAEFQTFKFPHMSSYNRMLLHRVSAYFGLDHNVDQSGKAIVVNRTDHTRMPAEIFGNMILNDCYTDQVRAPRRRMQSFDHSRGIPINGAYAVSGGLYGPPAYPMMYPPPACSGMFPASPPCQWSNSGSGYASPTFTMQAPVAPQIAYPTIGSPQMCYGSPIHQSNPMYYPNPYYQQPGNVMYPVLSNGYAYANASVFGAELHAGNRKYCENGTQTPPEGEELPGPEELPPASDGQVDGTVKKQD